MENCEGTLLFGMLVAWAALVPVLAGWAEMTAIEGTTWRLASVAHGDGETRAVADSVEATAFPPWAP